MHATLRNEYPQRYPKIVIMPQCVLRMIKAREFTFKRNNYDKQKQKDKNLSTMYKCQVLTKNTQQSNNHIY